MLPPQWSLSQIRRPLINSEGGKLPASCFRGRRRIVQNPEKAQDTDGLRSLRFQYIKATVSHTFVEAIFKTLLRRACILWELVEGRLSECLLLWKEAEGRPWKSLEKRAIKKAVCSWEANSYITNRRGRPLTQWNKETRGGTELFYDAIAGRL